MHTSTRALIWTSLAATLLVWPAEALAQRGRGGHGGRRPVVVTRSHRPIYHRPVYYPRYYYRPYYWSYWGSFGWYPYHAGWYGPWGYPYGYYGYYDDRPALRIEAKPREAQVYVDGYFAGLVDDFDGISQRLRAEPGEHEIQLYLDGHQTFKEKLLFRPGQTLKIKHVLEPLAAGEAPPPKPEPVARPPQPPQAQSGPARQPARRYGPGTRMEPAPAEPVEEAPPTGASDARSGYGTLAIRVQPRDAVILVDGEKWEGGDNRLSIELSEGTHRVEVRKDGFRTYSTEVRVQPGQTTTINVSLLAATGAV